MFVAGKYGSQYCKSTCLCINCCFFVYRYRVAIPVEYVCKQLGFKSAKDWEKFSQPLNLSFADADKSKLDCKASMSALPLSKPSQSA